MSSTPKMAKAAIRTSERQSRNTAASPRQLRIAVTARKNTAAMTMRAQVIQVAGIP